MFVFSPATVDAGVFPLIAADSDGPGATAAEAALNATGSDSPIRIAPTRYTYATPSCAVTSVKPVAPHADAPASPGVVGPENARPIVVNEPLGFPLASAPA